MSPFPESKCCKMSILEYQLCICLQTWCSMPVTFEKKKRQRNENITHDLLSLNPTWDQKQHARLGKMKKGRP